MGSATTYGFEVEKVLIGTTTIQDPVFFLEFGGKLYANDLLLNNVGGVYNTGASRRHVIASKASDGKVYLVSIGASYPPTLQAVSVNIKVHIAGG